MAEPADFDHRLFTYLGDGWMGVLTTHGSATAETLLQVGSGDLAFSLRPDQADELLDLLDRIERDWQHGKAGQQRSGDDSFEAEIVERGLMVTVRGDVPTSLHIEEPENWDSFIRTLRDAHAYMHTQS
jgi:hypothetical protein